MRRRCRSPTPGGGGARRACCGAPISRIPNATHDADEADLVDLVPQFAPEALAQQRLLVDNPARLYGFDNHKKTRTITIGGRNMGKGLTQFTRRCALLALPAALSWR